MPDVVTLGETCAVLVARSGGFLRHAAEFDRRLGGAESTVAAGVVRLGHSAGWISRVGDDEFGRFVTMTMRGEGVETPFVRVIEDRPTGVFFRENRQAGGSAVFYYRAGSAATSMTPDDLDEGYLAGAGFVHLTGITPALSETCRATVQAAAAMAERHGVGLCFDPNVRLKLWTAARAREVLEPLMAAATWVLAGREDLVKLIDTEDEEAMLRYLKRLGCERFVLKCGIDGAILVERGEVSRVPGIPVERPVDRFGAGDAFAAGFLSALLDGASAVDAVRQANAVASFAIQMPGNFEALPDRSALRRFMQQDAGIAR